MANAENLLLTAQVGSGIPGVPGKAGGLSIPVLKRDVDQLKNSVVNKQAEIAKSEREMAGANHEIRNLQNLLGQFERDLVKYECRG